MQAHPAAVDLLGVCVTGRDHAAEPEQLYSRPAMMLAAGDLHQPHQPREALGFGQQMQAQDSAVFPPCWMQPESTDLGRFLSATRTRSHRPHVVAGWAGQQGVVPHAAPPPPGLAPPLPPPHQVTVPRLDWGEKLGLDERRCRVQCCEALRQRHLPYLQSFPASHQAQKCRRGWPQNPPMPASHPSIAPRRLKHQVWADTCSLPCLRRRF